MADRLLHPKPHYDMVAIYGFDSGISIFDVLNIVLISETIERDNVASLAHHPGQRHVEPSSLVDDGQWLHLAIVGPGYGEKFKLNMDAVGNVLLPRVSEIQPCRLVDSSRHCSPTPAGSHGVPPCERPYGGDAPLCGGTDVHRGWRSLR